MYEIRLQTPLMIVGQKQINDSQTSHFSHTDGKRKSHMRLTLRTLLAYVDDILEPSDAKEIGAKINESGFAASLMNRIHDVMRRRRLTAPDLEGPGSGLDPNIVAEYLDNVLPPEKVADVEKVCLESDVHLAEMAASHQILTAALGEPVQVTPESREHMYALGPVGRPNPKQPAKTVAAQPAETRAAAVTTATGRPSDSKAVAPAAGRQDTIDRLAVSSPSEESSNGFQQTIPEFLRRRPIWRRALPYTVVGLIAVGWVGLVLYWPPFNLSTTNGDASKQADDLNGQSAANQNGGNALANTDGDRVEAAGANGIDEKPKDTAPVDRAPIDPPPPADESAGDTSVVDAKPPEKLSLPGIPAPQPRPDANSSQKPDEPVKVAATVPVPPTPKRKVVQQPAAEAPKFQYDSPGGILLRFDAKIEDWVVMPPRAIIHPGEQFASPEPFDAEVKIGDSLCRVTLVGGTAASILLPTKAAAIGFRIEKGRVILKAGKQAATEVKADAGDVKPVVLAVAVKDEQWQIALLTPGTVCGLEISPVQPERPNQNLGRNSYTGGLYVVKGSVRFSDGEGPSRVIRAAGWLSLTPTERLADKTLPGTEEGSPLLSIPGWLDRAAKRNTSTLRRYTSLFEKEFDDKRPLSENVPPLINDSRPYISSLAVKCLALVDDYASLAAALNAGHEESRMAAIIGLRRWLPTSEKHGPLLKEELQKNFPPDEVDVIHRLLWGFNKQDGTDHETSTQLVEWLDHTNITVRELAFLHIYRMTGIKYDYHPLRSVQQRRSAIGRWEGRIKNGGGLIEPAKKTTK